MDTGTEKFLIESLIGELNKSFPLNLDPKPFLVREGTTADKKLKLVLVGMSHARNLAEALGGMGPSVSLLKITSCRPTTVSMDQAAAELVAAIDGNEDAIVVFQFLDNAAYYARTEDGCLMPAQRDEDGSFHLVGDLVVAPKELFLHSLKTSLPLFKAAGSRQKFVLSPLPRYLTGSCCSGAGHVSNRDNTDFGERLMEDLTVLKRQIKDFCHLNHLGGVTCLNSAVLMANISGGRQLADEERELLVANWGPDPVHPGKGGYLKLATNLLSRIQGNAASAVSGGGQHLPVIKKRRWADEDRSVIVRHPQMFQGGGRGNLRGQWRRGWGRPRRN